MNKISKEALDFLECCEQWSISTALENLAEEGKRVKICIETEKSLDSLDGIC